MTLLPSTRVPYQYIFPTDYPILMKVDVNFLNKGLKFEEIINISELIVQFLTNSYFNANVHYV